MEKTFRSLASDCAATLRAHAVDEASEGEIAGTFVALALRHAGMLGLSLKHSAFREEAEWRLILLPQVGLAKPLVEFRPTLHGLVPYVPIALAKPEQPLDLAKVYVGPMQDAGLGCAAASQFLNKHGYTAEGLVVPSRVPFRGRT